MPQALDPITLEVIRNALPAISDEMSVDLQRTSYNMMIYEVRDYCTALLDPDGALISQNIGGVSHFVADLGVEQPRQQLRPLHMVLVKGRGLKPLYAHCLGGGPKPRITVTSHPAADGQWVWYLGGDIAEADGVARSEAAQIAAAQKEVQQLLPWIDLSDARWATLRVDRAEPAQSGLVRPDNAFLAEQGSLLVGWPTKLALSPDFADRVIAALERDGIQPGTHAHLPELPRPPQAQPVWEELLP